jgi:hypothetical protein
VTDNVNRLYHLLTHQNPRHVIARLTYPLPKRSHSDVTTTPIESPSPSPRLARRPTRLDLTHFPLLRCSRDPAYLQQTTLSRKKDSARLSKCSASTPAPNLHNNNPRPRPPTTPHRSPNSRKPNSTNSKARAKRNSSCRPASRAQAQTRTRRASRRSMAFRRISWRLRYVFRHLLE